MFETYAAIFNQRGSLYHQAMLNYPQARAIEFKTVINLLDLQPGQVLCDVPSGGCYISQFIKTPIKLISVETSQEFMSQTSATNNNAPLLCQDITAIPLLDATIDRVVSLAGLHHVPDQASFYREAYRLLKTQGILCLADVRQGSGVDGFLNTFVNQYNSMGHQGDFLDNHTLGELEAAGFDVIRAAPEPYTWEFESISDMARCCQLLFGIDQADDQTILAGIRHYLGYELRHGRCYMNWELYFIKALKPQAE